MEQNVRPDFYEGQYLGADDLDASVVYHRIQQARHALGAHTWGIGAGLELRERALPGGDVDVTILPGVAWDGFGRTIVVLEPARINPDRFANFQADTPADGLLVKVWLRYSETASQGPAPGFEVCRPDGQFARIAETFAIEIGEPTEPAHGSIVVGGRSVEALKVKGAFVTGAPNLYDESVAYQEFPEGGNRPIWLVPIGYVRWLKTGGQPGRLMARKDSATPPDSDLIRAFRQYAGVVAEAITASDGLIRLRPRTADPAASVSHVDPPRVTTNPAAPPENDLVWVEGNLHVLGDARVSGGKIDWRNSAGETDGVPLAARRVEPNAKGGKDLQVVLGAADPAVGAHAFAVGRGELDAASGQLKPSLKKHLVVLDTGMAGIGVDQPPQLLTLGGDGGTRLEIARVGPSLPWSTNSPDNPGAFVINQQSQGSSHVGADFGLMRDGKLRVALGDNSTIISGQGGAVMLMVNFGEPGDAEVMRVSSTGKVGIGTTSPDAKLHVNGDLALDKIGSGAPRNLANNGTLIWNDGTWLRLNQNLDFSKPIHGVHTPGLFAPESLNVGGVSSWADPGGNNVTVAGKVAIGTLTGADTLHVEGSMHCKDSATFGSFVSIATDANVDRDVNALRDVNMTRDCNVGRNVNVAGHVTLSGNLNVSGTKNFAIAHPLARESMRLVHASLEGPEAAVFYRGEAQLTDGAAVIELPLYFEALTRADQRTVQLTPIVDDGDTASALGATRVRDGHFRVRMITPGNPAQRFWWEVKAVRADLPPLVVER
jgi:hypothetical protein